MCFVVRQGKDTRPWQGVKKKQDAEIAIRKTHFGGAWTRSNRGKKKNEK